jgi:hypothetical protein
MTTEKRSVDESEGKSQTPAHRISAETGRALEELRAFLITVTETSPEALDGIAEWREAFLHSLLRYELEHLTPATESTRSYKIVPIESTSGNRVYRANLYIDEAFGTQSARVQHNAELMLSRIVAGQTRAFIDTAQEFGLTWRRNRSFPFPHPLPYSSPPPSTAIGRYTEEAMVIAAAFHFPLTLAAPGIKFVINQYTKQSSGHGLWELGFATINLYNDVRFLRINLNQLAFSHFNDNVWAGVIAHETLHNLGWSHPDGGYDRSKAIVNYEWCVRGGTAFTRDEEFDDHQLIR